MSTLPETVLFKDLVSENEADIKSYMEWQNYTLNDVTIPIIELLQEHALMVLTKSYGLFHVEHDIYDEFCADVFMYFPVLAQQLAITRLIDAYGVVKDDVETQTTTRTENLSAQVDQSSELTAGTSVTENNTTNLQQKTTGTVQVENDTSNVQDSTTTINNTSNVAATGSRNVSVAHQMPEAQIDGTTNWFPTDAQGTPTLNGSVVQSAAQNFSTANPLSTTETSTQSVDNTVTGNNDSTTTNDITVADTGSTTRTSTNSGSDTSQSGTTTDSTNEISEIITSNVTNKQYAYEIKAFLDTADSLIAFKKWEDRFSWLIGIV
jgi:hypothetical protein